MTKQKYLLPIVALTIANILWGFNTVFIKIGLETIPAPIYLSSRMILASLCLLPFAIRAWKPLKKSDVFRFILSSVFAISLSALTLNIGLSKTPAFNAAVIWLLFPILLLICSASFLKEKISLRTFFGIVIAILGSILIIGKPLPGTNATDSLVGNLFLLLSVLFNVVAVLLSKPLMKKANPYQATFLSLFPGAALIGVYALTMFGTWDIHSVSNRSLGAFIVSTVIVLIANVLFYYALRYKDAHTTGIYQYIDPAVTVLAAWFILNERPNAGFILGTMLILVGICLAELHKSRHHLMNHKKG